MRKILAYISITYLAVWSLLMPDNAHAMMAKHFHCDELPNRFWTVHMVKSYARAIAYEKYGWNRTEFKALSKLWTAESHWNPGAYNHDVELDTGLHAGGIPQILGMKTTTPAPLQVERGLEYIQQRYGKPSIAWQHHRTHGWY